MYQSTTVLSSASIHVPELLMFFYLFIFIAVMHRTMEPRFCQSYDIKSHTFLIYISAVKLIVSNINFVVIICVLIYMYIFDI